MLQWCVCVAMVCVIRVYVCDKGMCVTVCGCGMCHNGICITVYDNGVCVWLWYVQYGYMCVTKVCV